MVKFDASTAVNRLSHIIRRIWQESRFLLNDLLCKTGFRKGLLRNRPGTRILVYHGVCKENSTRYNSRFITLEVFENQLIYFKENFHLQSLQDCFDGKAHTEKLTLSLTFDDGYANNFHDVLPLLEKYQIPATFFITTIQDAGHDILWPDLLDLAAIEIEAPIQIEGKKYVVQGRKGYFEEESGQSLKAICRTSEWGFKQKLVATLSETNGFLNRPELQQFWKLMPPEEIRIAAESPLITIGAHGYYHNNLGQIAPENAVVELIKSMAYLEGIIQQPITALAWPDGSYTRDLVAKAYQMGYAQQLAVDYLYPADANDTQLLPRLGINPWLSLDNQLICILNNGYYA